jgi:hypothetical protein
MAIFSNQSRFDGGVALPGRHILVYFISYMHSLRGLVNGNGLPPTARCDEECIEAIRALLLSRCERPVCQSRNRRAERERNDAADQRQAPHVVTHR